MKSMIELERFLAAIYDSLSEAEILASQHGKRRLIDGIQQGKIPKDASLPVYHATNVNVQLRADLSTQEEDGEVTMYLTEDNEDGNSTLTFDIELYELLSQEDFEDVAGEVVEADKNSTEADSRETVSKSNSDQTEKPT